CEPVHNLIQRRRLTPSGATFIAERTENGKEFLASTDPWFHPVFLTAGPDGALYVVDFYRKYVEHPQWVAEELKTTVPWRTGEEHGRIWRIRPKNWTTKAAKPNLSRARSSELVKRLAEENGWWRDTAQRLLVERQDRSSAPALERMARQSSSPLGRLHALLTLVGLDVLKPELVRDALRDPDARVREHAVRLSEPYLAGGAIAARREKTGSSPSQGGNAGATRRLFTPAAAQSGPIDSSPSQIDHITKALLALTGDADARVRLQLALTLGELEGGQKLAALAQLAEIGGGDRWESLAILTSVGSRPWLFWKMLRNPGWMSTPDEGQAWFSDKL